MSDIRPEETSERARSENSRPDTPVGRLPEPAGTDLQAPRQRIGSTTFRSLRYRNARLFFTGLLISNIGTWLQLTVMALLVFRLTGESTAVGITVACQFLPMLLLGAWVFTRNT